jgi:parallel beta-helix repeat protein
MRAAAGISVLLLATIIAYVGSQGTVEARGRTPVECGDTLDIPGGRYVLTHDLQCSDYSGIMIAADDVRLDLSGFTIALVKTQSTPSSYAISVGYAAGGTCVPTSGVRISGGAVNGFSGGIGLCLASDARISQMVFADNSGTDGRAISLWQSDATTISDVSITRSQLCGVCLFYSSGNRLKRVAVQDVSGAYPHFYGLLL